MKITVKDGMGRETNPYHCENMSAYTCWELPDASICKGCIDADKWESEHPPLPAYDQQGNVLGDGEWEVIQKDRDVYTGEIINDYLLNAANRKTEHIYQSTEVKQEVVARELKAVDENSITNDTVEGETVEDVEIWALQKTLRDLLFIRPFDIHKIESAAVKLCDAVAIRFNPI